MRTRWTKIATVAFATTLLSACGSEGGGGNVNDDNFKPSGTVEMVVGAQPGGGSDVMARTFVAAAEDLRDGLNVKVSNFDSIEAYSYVKGKSANDGMLITATYGNVILSPLAQNLNYFWDDYTPLAMFATDPSFLVVRADSPFNSLADLASTATKKNVTMGVVTAAGVNTVHSAQIAESMDIKLNNVVFESGAEEMTSILAGDIDAALMEPSEFVEQYKAKKVRPIMVMSSDSHPSETFASIQTASDAGIEGDVVTQFRAFFGAPDMSDAGKAYWVKVLEEWTETASYEDYVTSNDLIPTLLVGDDLTERLTSLEEAAREALAKK